MSSRKFFNKKVKQQPISQASPSNFREHQSTSSESLDSESNSYRTNGSSINLVGDQTSTNLNHSQLPENTKLSQISMLGSHDAGTYAYSRKKNGGKFNNFGALFPFAYKTQNLTLSDQADAGVKYFDIRVKKRKDGSFGFTHGGSIAGGNAVDDVNSLLNKIKGDSDNFYLLKFVIEGDKIIKGTTKSDGDGFFEKTLGLDNSNHINKSEFNGQKLGAVTVNVLKENKNLAIMVNKYKGNNSNYWDYKSQTNTKWPNSTDWKTTASTLKKFHKNKPSDDLINIIQTNMPFISGNPFTMGRLKALLAKGAPGIADAVDEMDHPGVISGDYIGHARSATNRFKNWILRENSKVKNSPQQ